MRLSRAGYRCKDMLRAAQQILVLKLLLLKDCPFLVMLTLGKILNQVVGFVR